MAKETYLHGKRGKAGFLAFRGGTITQVCVSVKRDLWNGQIETYYSAKETYCSAKETYCSAKETYGMAK